MIVGPSLIMVNQHILKGGFPYPMFLSGLGVLATGIAARVLIFLGEFRVKLIFTVIITLTETV
jgi:hypothetical protein